MDADSLKMILDNTRESNDAAYAACVSVLFGHEALPSQANYPGMKEGYELAQALGDAVKAVVWEYASTEHRLTDDETTISGTIFSTALGHISDADLGALYYVSVRERWCYANDVEPYPA